jgi:predicted peptidase
LNNLRKLFIVSILANALSISACTSLPTAEERKKTADDIASKSGWISGNLSTRLFELKIYHPQKIERNKITSIYIEGDGLAWLTSNQKSSDPTPIDPIALKMATQQPSGNVIYLARPCQYTGVVKSCESRYWTNGRFSPEIVSAINEAISQLKQRYSIEKFELIGYSGGGALAALVTAQRTDIVRLITVAGNMDTAKWTQIHRLSPLDQSLNPIDFAKQLSGIEQYHFVGQNDRVIPVEVVESFLKHSQQAQNQSIQIIEGFNHACCWSQAWPALWKKLSYP